MARRSDHTREQLKEMAVQAGLEIIRSEGLSGFSARGVAGRIGYTAGTLYHLFGSYDNLLLEINGRTLDHWFHATEQALRSAKKGSHPIRVLATSYIRYSQDHANEWRTLFEYRVAEGTPLPEWYSAKMNRFFDLLEHLLLPLLHQNKKQAQRAARVLWAGIHGICILAHSRKLDLVSNESPEILAASLVDHYLAGIQAGSH